MAADFNVRPPTAHTYTWKNIYIENCIDKESVEKVKKQQPETHMQIEFASQRFSFLAQRPAPIAKRQKGRKLSQEIRNKQTNKGRGRCYIGYAEI